MAKKKSKAQIRRMQLRAESRGEEYVAPEPTEEEKLDEENETKEETAQLEDSSEAKSDSEIQKEKLMEIALKLKTELKEIEENTELKAKDRRSAKRKAEAIAATDAGMQVTELFEWYEKNSADKGENAVDPKTKKLKAIALRLQRELKQIEANEDLKSKDRRSAKRKVEAIASEESKMSAEELLAWYEKYLKEHPESNTSKEKRSHDPYIAFFGQLSFQTTKEQLFEHIKTQLKDEFKVTQQNTKIRLLSDKKTKKSRGMAFVEVDDPEMLYALLKLHQTFLDGRRMNVERSAGGSKNSETRKARIAQYRKEQDEYFGEVVDSILSEYRKTGELRDDELDDGVVALCKRHSGPIVRAAVAKYIEGSGRDMDNPSAYLTFLLTKFAEEGIYEDNDKEKHSGKPKKRRPGNDDRNTSKRLKSSSTFAKAGVDMSISEGGSAGGLAKIFPSAKRGRGRGYM